MSRFTNKERQGAIAVVLVAVAISVAGFLMKACTERETILSQRENVYQIVVVDSADNDHLSGRKGAHKTRSQRGKNKNNKAKSDKRVKRAKKGSPDKVREGYGSSRDWLRDTVRP